MIWLTWRQFRTQATTAVAALAAFAILLALTRPHMDSLYAASGITGCHGGACGVLASQFLNQLSNATPFGGRGALLPAGANLYTLLYGFTILVILIAPAIIGIFWGAPLIARELETRTFRLAWNQSTTRTRWLAVKLALIGLAAMAVAGAFTLVQTWWAAPINRAMSLGGSVSVFSGGRFSIVNFATHGITPLGYATFGFALGVTAGVLIRRAVPAMAVTLAVFAVVQFVMPLWVREPGAWIMSSQTVNLAGQPVGALPAACMPAVQAVQNTSGGAPPSMGPLQHCLDSHGIREAVSYQPLSHFWPLQSVETGIFLALALALAGFCFWKLGRRLS
jgi:hypothetical protein